MANSICSGCFRNIKDGELHLCNVGTKDILYRDPAFCFDIECPLYIPGVIHKKGIAICSQ